MEGKAVESECSAHPVPEAARLIGVSTTTGWKMVREGNLRTLDLPGIRRRLVPQTEIDRILRSESSATEKENGAA